MEVRTALLAATWLSAACGAALAQPAPLRPAERTADAVELEPMVVRPEINPLERSRERLREMLEDAPCLGCGPEQEAARANPYGWIGVVLTALTGLGAEPPDPDAEQRLEHRLRSEWRLAEYGPEMDALR